MSRRRRTGAAGPGLDDTAPDVYSVKRLEDGVFQVKHYVSLEATKACCNVRVDRTDRDRELARVDDVDVDVITLRRAQLTIDQKHMDLEKRGAA